MPNVCSKSNVRGCPASFYLSCPAYKTDKNCWEVDVKPCCTSPRTRCATCPTLAKGKNVLASLPVL